MGWMLAYEVVHTQQFLAEYLIAETGRMVADPFAPKFYCPIQNNIDGGLNFVTYEQGFVTICRISVFTIIEHYSI